jgi:hypothetical protein
MGAYQDGSLAWWSAQDACYQFLCREIGGVDGKTAFLGDQIADYLVNVWCFVVSGGQEQVQNYQVRSPAMHYIANAVLIGKYENLKDAMQLGMSIQNKMPGYFSKDTNILPMNRRGIEPNVEVFEVTEHPEVASVLIENEKGNKIPKTIWGLAVRFRVVYNNDKVMTGDSIGQLPNT